MDLYFKSVGTLFKGSSSLRHKTNPTFRIRLCDLQGNAIRVDSESIIPTLIMDVAPFSLQAGQGDSFYWRKELQVRGVCGFQQFNF